MHMMNRTRNNSPKELQVYSLIVCLILCLTPAVAFGEPHDSAGTHRIVVFPEYAEEILLEMAGTDRVVYVGHEYFELGESYSPTMPLTKDIPGRIWSMSDDEFILSLQPDLVVLDASFREDYEGGGLFPNLLKAHIPVVFTVHPEALEGICEVIEQLGNAIGEPERAAEMIGKLRNEMDEISRIVDDLPPSADNSVFYYSNWQTDFTWFADYIGLKDVCVNSWLEDADAEEYDNEYELDEEDENPEEYGYEDEWEEEEAGPREYYYDAELDEIAFKSEPAVIFYYPHYIDTDGSILQIDGYRSHLPDDLMTDPRLAHVPAVINGRIYPLTLYRSQYVVQTLVDMLCYAYPETVNRITGSDALSRYALPHGD